VAVPRALDDRVDLVAALSNAGSRKRSRMRRANSCRVSFVLGMPVRSWLAFVEEHFGAVGLRPPPRRRSIT
jgi:hypothetical protein